MPAEILRQKAQNRPVPQSRYAPLFSFATISYLNTVCYCSYNNYGFKVFGVLVVFKTHKTVKPC